MSRSKCFFPSGFKESAVVCLDNSGDNKSGAIFYGNNRKLYKKFIFLEKIV